MSEVSTGENEEKPKKKAPRRKPLWLAVPAGQRTVEREGKVEHEPLFTIEQFTSLPDLRKNLEARELDATNCKGILLFRADAVPIETKMRAQVVIKFGRDDDEGEGDEKEEGMV